MPQNTHLEIVNAESERWRETVHVNRDPQQLHDAANILAHNLVWLPNSSAPQDFVDRTAIVSAALKPIFAALDLPAPAVAISDDFRWLYDNGRLFYTELHNIEEAFHQEKHVPRVRNEKNDIVPRSLALAEKYLQTVSYEFNEQEFVLFTEVFQKTTVMDLRELWLLVSALKLVLLQQIAVRGQRLVNDPTDNTQKIAVCIRSLREVGQISWKDVLEPLFAVDQLLRQDPAGAYAQMDFDSRHYYRKTLSKIADRSDCTELEVAAKALALAKEASRRSHTDPRIGLRESHVGYYLIDKGAETLYHRVRFRPPFGERIQNLLRKHPDEFFMLGIEILTLAIMAGALLFLTDPFSSPMVIFFSMLLLLLPSSQCAVQIVNYLVTAVLPATTLPKLDFSEAIADNCVTMVAIPSLLLHEKQVRGLIENLEVRYLGNHDPNIHFALLTDLPDSREPAREDSELITLCTELINELNEKYASQNSGSFFLFHRHRIYNPREKLWMGWERKRGKLLDLNKLLRGQFDSFPVKIGDLSILPSVRYVITLDSDTELPRDSAQRMIGAMAHPLNQAVIDPEKNIVVAGYGILQPRVGVSVQSTTRSRLAAIYAGETGFDIYTRAVSDAYQDLYGEGSFTGKGIYEVDAVHQVLDRRFPRNALLSHDLIEGAYARAGLASDIEVIEDYPSHYSAYNRRKHRWLRGDWQILSWLLPHVPDESADYVANPISLISWWKIFDNLRRSLVEPAVFVLFVVGWFMPNAHPWQWTLCTLCILFIPSWFQLVFNLVKAVVKFDLTVARDSLTAFYTSNLNLFFTLIFLAHQAILSLDAVIRTLVRRFVTQRRLLEWETAAEAELGTKRTPVDLYLDWTPVLTLGLGLLVWTTKPHSLAAALPILVLWVSSRLVSLWLNHPPLPARNQASRKDLTFLRRMSVQTWRYFSEFSTAEHNWLIPDNVQEQPAAIAARISPTNIGFLLNARQVACEFGYLTVPEFAELTLCSLGTMVKLNKFRGHLLNWYDTRTLQPLAPAFVSSVDSGNLLASLWTLQQGSLDRLQQPMLQSCLAEGYLDYLRLLAAANLVPKKAVSACERESKTNNWLQCILKQTDTVFARANENNAKSKKAAAAKWFADEAVSRLHIIQQTVKQYAPWFSPEFASLRNDESLNLSLMDSIALEDLPEFIDSLAERVHWVIYSTATQKLLYEQFHERLLMAHGNVVRLISDLRKIAHEAGKLADGMDFKFLLSKRRKLISVGFDVDNNELLSACYDLLASESRTAAFVAIAKDDIPQESWFLLGRAHTLDGGQPVLLSWTGTLFEYLMPSLWMRSYSNTLLERTRAAAVRSQQTYGARKGTPWGISESAYFKLDELGNYQYYAFGLPHLALRKPEIKGLVISPYSTFLGLDVDPPKALSNLHAMADMGWLGDYGFYEAADFSAGKRKFWKPRYQLVRCWMAHHQGMSLLALANFLNADVVQKWFHAERRVQATELLLHEKPVAHVRRKDIPRRTAAA
jgi:hypothetical protein